MNGEGNFWGFFNSLVAPVAIALTGGLYKLHEGRMKQMEKDHLDLARDMAEHKLYSEKNFVDKASIQQSLGRVHDTLERYAAQNENTAKEIRADIKELMRLKLLEKG